LGHSLIFLNMILNAQQTAQALPYAALAAEIARVLQDSSVQAPPRVVQSLPGGASLFVMPAHDARLAITKLITFTPANAGTGLATIQGDVVVFDIATGQRCLVLDGPTVTARRTAAVTLLAAQKLATAPQGPLLIIGAGVQGRAHLEALVNGLGVRQVFVYSRSATSAQALVRHAQSLFQQLGMADCQAGVVASPTEVLAQCTLVVTCTPARAHVLHSPALLHPQVFVSAVGAFTPQMVELAPSVVQHFAQQGRIVVDTVDAAHEAGDLLQAQIDVPACATLQQCLGAPQPSKPMLFKSCGWAGWDLAAARLAARQQV
jgi:1-piperideine-2-carboxylate/1-pyrroline-2-carboxylate reductase [NAD(P)H]